jgi:hypothetical protein
VKRKLLLVDDMKKILTIALLLLLATPCFSATRYKILSTKDISVVASNVGIGSTSPRSKLDVDGNVYATFFNGDGSRLQNLPATGGAVTAVTASLPLSSSGGTTPNITVDLTNYASTAGLNAGYITRASAAKVVTDSAIYQNGSNIGIGTTVPLQKLDVEGSIYVLTNIGIGTSIPAARLDVAGSGYLSPVGVTADPCGTQPEGTAFYNSTNHTWCYCDNVGVDVKIYNSEIGCF